MANTTALNRIHNKDYPKNHIIKTKKEEFNSRKGSKIKGWQVYSGIYHHIDQLDEILTQNEIFGRQFAPYMISNAYFTIKHIDQLLTEQKKNMMYTGNLLNNYVAFQRLSFNLTKPIFKHILIDEKKQFEDFKTNMINMDISSDIRSFTIEKKKFDAIIDNINCMVNAVIEKNIDWVFV